MFDEIMKAEIDHIRKTSVNTKNDWKKLQKRAKQTGINVDMMKDEMKQFALSQEHDSVFNSDQLLD